MHCQTCINEPVHNVFISLPIRRNLFTICLSYNLETDLYLGCMRNNPDLFSILTTIESYVDFIRIRIGLIMFLNDGRGLFHNFFLVNGVKIKTHLLQKGSVSEPLL